MNRNLLPHPVRTIRQTWRDILDWFSGSWFWLGSLLVLLFLGGSLWFQGSSMLQSIRNQEQFRRIAQSDVYGVLSRTWWVLFELSSVMGILIGAVSIAPDFEAGRMQYLLLQPVSRQAFFVSRVVRSLFFTLLFYFGLAAGAFLVLYYWIGFGNLIEKEFVDYVHYRRGEMLLAYIRLLCFAVPAVTASTGLGIFLSSVFSEGTKTIFIALFLYVVLRMAGTYPAGVVEDYFFLGNLDLFGTWLRELGNAVSSTMKNLQNVEITSPKIWSSVGSYFLFVTLGDIVFLHADLR